MTNRWIRNASLAALLGFGASTIGCGYFLFPERRGNRGGYLAGGTLAMDLLWLIPGIVPGAVALIVDFSSGAIYTHGGYAVRTAPNGTVALRLPNSETPAVVELRLVTASAHVIAHQTVAVGPDIHDKWVQLDPGDAVRSSREQVFFEVVNASGATARLAAPVMM
jgi:hypothetical protein